MPIRRYKGIAYPAPPDYLDVVATFVTDELAQHALELIIASEEDDQCVDLEVTATIEPDELVATFDATGSEPSQSVWKISKNDILAPGETRPFKRTMSLPNGTNGHADAQLRVKVLVRTRTFGRTYDGYILVKPPRFPK